MAGVAPVPRRAGDHAGVAVHNHLRRLILQGRLPPGTILKQIELAPSLGVSPTPLREAIMRLQEEGLVEAVPQRRARVVGFDAAQLESIFVQRILLESLGARMTTERITPAKLEEIDKRLLEGARLTTRHRRLTRTAFEQWQEFNRDFHLCLVAELGPGTLDVVGRLIDRGGHYFLARVYRLSDLHRKDARVHWPSVGLDWLIASAEHERIAEAFRLGDADRASASLAAHLAGTVLTSLKELEPDYEPKAVKAAMAITCPGFECA